MIIIDLEIVAEWIAAHPDAEASLTSWLLETERREWANPNQMKESFGNASLVKPWTVFNIGGNKYRMITQIDYQSGAIFIDRILTHRDYDKGDWK